MKLIVGIDEVGRGPLAGPVTIGIVVSRISIDIPELNDSKRMTEAARLRVYSIAQKMRSKGALSFGVFSSHARTVDAYGINKSIERAITRGLSALLPNPDGTTVFLDGLLSAPSKYQQKTVIHGDSLIPVISLASVIAKVRRDRYMADVIDRRYPAYGFSRHKGYGTPEHLSALSRLGPSVVHRRSFLKAFA